MVIDQLSKLRAHLAAPVDIAALAALRMLFGALISVAAVRFVANGWVQELILAPRHHFSYPGFEFVRPWPGALMYWHFVALAACGVALMLGYRTRWAAALCALGVGYVELIDRASYLNHYYLVCLIAGLLVCLPAGAALSLDAARSALRARAVPRWTLWVLRLQVAVVYIFAGCAKLNADWLLSAQPLRIWLAAAGADLPWLGGYLSQPACAFAASWAAAAFDLLIVPALLARRTRTAGLIVACAFHLATAWLFPIGMFPWIMLSCLSVFLPADWPRVVLAAPAARDARVEPVAPALAWLCALHCVVQVGVPLHHHLFTRDSAWTQVGFDFAWKVMLAEKSGVVRYRVRELGSAQDTTIEPAAYLAPFQLRALGQDPRLIISFARHLGREHRARTGKAAAVFADAFASLNGRPLQPLLAADVDLTHDSLAPNVILPLR